MIDLENQTVREALARHDIAAVFRYVLTTGVTQRELAVMVKMSQSEVSEILKGRRVQAYDVLVRICEGLDIPRGYMGLAYTEDELDEMSEEMKRRALLAVGTTALVGSPVLGEVLELPKRVEPTPLPSRLAASDITAMRELTTSLQGVARTFGGCADVIGGVANRSRALLALPATDKVKADMKVALAELHTVAGWCCVDAGLSDQARDFFALAMDLGDSYQLAWAFRHAGIQMNDAGAWNDGLKAFQLAGFSATDPELVACLEIESALPLAAMGHRGLALDALKKGYDHPQSNIFDAADLDNVTSHVHLHLGNLVTAESFAKASLAKWRQEGSAKRDRVEAEIALATVHLRAGEPDGANLVKQALTDMAPLRSVRARAKLLPLEQALMSRHDSTCQDLARTVRQMRAV